MIWDFLVKIVNFLPSTKQNHQHFLFLSISYKKLTSLSPKLPKSILLPRLTLPKHIPLARPDARKRVPLGAAHPQVPLLWKNPHGIILEGSKALVELGINSIEVYLIPRDPEIE